MSLVDLYNYKDAYKIYKLMYNNCFLLQTSGRLQIDETQKVHTLLANIGIDAHYVDQDTRVEYSTFL